MPRRSSTAPDVNLFSRLKRLVDAADIEGLLRMGAPADEYDPETSKIAAGVRAMDVLTVETAEALVSSVWGAEFGLLVDDGRDDAYQPAFHELAVSIVAEVEALEAGNGSDA